MEHIKTLTRRDGTDVGYHNSNIEPLNGVGKVGKHGIDKTYTLARVIELAHEVDANIIIKSGPNAKWYLKRFQLDSLDTEIAKQSWRDTSRCTMWIVEFMRRKN